MKLYLRLDLENQFGYWGAGIEIPEIYCEQFMPLKTCDDVLIAMATGEMIAESESVRTIIGKRKDAAEILAKELTKIIISAMKREDTHNGYLKADKSK